MSEQITCYECKKVMPEGSFYKSSIYWPTKKGKCKECRLAFGRYNEEKRRVEARPHEYMSCDDCDRSFHQLVKNTQRLATTCRFCGSKNIYREAT